VLLKQVLDGCIVWNVHNTVFGSKHAQLHDLLFVAVLTFTVLTILWHHQATPTYTVNIMTWRVISLVNGHWTSHKIWGGFLYRVYRQRK